MNKHSEAKKSQFFSAKRLLISLALLVIVFGGSMLAMSYLSTRTSNQTANQPGSYSIENGTDNAIDLSLVANIKFKDPRQDLSAEDLKNGPVYVEAKLWSGLSEDSRNNLKTTLGVAEFKEFSDTNGAEGLNADTYPANSLLISHFSDINFKLKVPTLLGKTFWTGGDYPLQLEVKGDEKMALAKNLELKPEDLSVDKTEIKRMFIGGELIPARAVDRLFLNRVNNYTFLFDRFKEQMQTADLTIAMLENPLSGNPKPCTGCTTFVGDAQNAKGFKEVGIDILSFGNHAGDGGLRAVQDTEKLLAEQGIGISGLSSQNLENAQKLAIRDFGGMKLGLLGFDDVAWFYFANDKKWGVNHFSTAESRATKIDKALVEKTIKEAKAQVDYLVVYPSWGTEYRDTANAQQVELAHLLIDNGVDMIVGSHPHWVQNFEVYKGKPIFYSLGNFIFDQTHTDPTRQSIVVNAYYYKGQPVSFAVQPHMTCGYHQTNNNLADKVLAGQLTYQQADAMPEKQGCVYFQAKPIGQGHPFYNQIWDRFIKSTKL